MSYQEKKRLRKREQSTRRKGGQNIARRWEECRNWQVEEIRKLKLQVKMFQNKNRWQKRKVESMLLSESDEDERSEDNEVDITNALLSNVSPTGKVSAKHDSS